MKSSGILFLTLFLLGIPFHIANSKSRDASLETHNKSQPKADASESQSIERIPATDRNTRNRKSYIFQHRKTGEMIQFWKASLAETIDHLKSVAIPVAAWHSCGETTDEEDPTLDSLETEMNLRVLINTLNDQKVPRIDDAAQDVVLGLSPCSPGLRIHLKAISLILDDYRLVKMPES